MRENAVQPQLADDAHFAEGEPHVTEVPPQRPVSATGIWELRLRGELVTARLQRADSMLPRMRGLLGRKRLERHEGMWIDPCDAIHMMFMRFAIDAIFLDAQQQVVKVAEDVQPWRMARGGRYAHSVLELPQGTAAFFNIRAGDRMTLVPAGADD